MRLVWSGSRWITAGISRPWQWKSKITKVPVMTGNLWNMGLTPGPKPGYWIEWGYWWWYLWL